MGNNLCGMVNGIHLSYLPDAMTLVGTSEYTFESLTSDAQDHHRQFGLMLFSSLLKVW